MIRLQPPCLFVLALAVTVSVLTPLPGSAAEDQKLPHLDTHTFVPNTFVPDPFVRSYIRNGTAVGGTNSVFVEAVTLPDSTVIFGLQTQVATVVIDFDWQHRMKDWVAVRGHFEVFGRLGSSTSSLLSEGITGIGTYELGWLFRLAETRKNALTLDLYMQRSQGSFVNILDWLEKIIEDGGLLPGNTIVRGRDSLRGIGALQYARAFSSLLGFTAMGSVGYGEKLDRDGENAVIYAVRGGLSISLHDTTRVPFGLYVGYGISDWDRGGGSLQGAMQTGVLRINYMGFDDFIIGVNLDFQSANFTGIQDPVRGMAGMITLRYYY